MKSDELYIRHYFPIFLSPMNPDFVIPGSWHSLFQKRITDYRKERGDWVTLLLRPRYIPYDKHRCKKPATTTACRFIQHRVRRRATTRIRPYHRTLHSYSRC